MKGENMNTTKWFTVSFLAVLLIVSSVPIYLYLNASENSYQTALNKFSSIEELKTFLETASSSSNSYWLRAGESMEESSDAQAAAPKAADTDYSETNIQVEGVDEADIVKTDGEYIYVVSGNNLTIVKAYPPEEARIVSKISLTGNIAGIFVNGDKLAVFETEYGVYPLYETTVAYDLGSSSEEVKEPAEDDETEVAPPSTNGSAPDEENRTSSSSSEPTKGNTTAEEPSIAIAPIVYDPPTTSIKVYDISDRGNPVLTRNVSVDGSYFSARMIGDYIYVVATQWTVFIETEVFLPRVHSDNETEVIPPEEIYYYNSSDTSYSFTTIVAVNIMDDAQVATHETILLGGTSTIYVSQNNIYLTFLNYNWQENEEMTTTIQRISIDKQVITFAAQGEVPGYVLNQFSMDEYNGYFRIATTINTFVWRTFAEDASVEEVKSKNNVYVLDMNLNVVGKLEDLAPGEQIYSARFMGDRCYLVTFEQIDPFFVIDVANPTAPKVLGYLKIPGFSGYLHPYDNNHVIGIGEQDNSVKLSLFDVTDVTAPKETSKYIVEAEYSYSPVLYDHKAFLFDKTKQLLALPVSTNSFLVRDGVRSGDGGYWQGAYIFDVSLEQGFVLEGTITHQSGTDQYEYGHSVQRILYIGDVLYTISDIQVKMNSLETLAEINEVELS
jgi:inhibitor of cysteine peptidase